MKEAISKKCVPAADKNGTGGNTLSVAQALTLALDYFQAGKMPESERTCRQVLTAVPDNAEACHLLGLIAREVGQSDLAIQWLNKAITLRPGVPDMYNNLGTVFLGLGQLAAAEECFSKATALQPDFVEALYNRGIAVKERGDLDAAARIFRQAIALRPDYVDAHHNLGVVLMEQGELEAAMGCWRQVLVVRPDYAEAYNNLGAVLKKQGLLAEAMDSWCKALELKPDCADACNNLGVAHREKDQLAEAVAYLRRAISLQPQFVEAYNNLGVALKANGEAAEAIACFRRAISLQPDYAEAYSNLGMVLKEQQEPAEAMKCWRQAIALRPDFAEVYNSLGAVLYEQGHLEEAMDHYRKSLALNPDNAEVHNNLGGGYLDLGQVPEAMACFRRALSLEPDYAIAHRHLSIAKKHSGYDDDLRSMEALYLADNVGDEQKIHLAFGLGKAFEEIGDYQKSFNYLQEGNRLHRRGHPFSVPAQRDFFDRIKRVFSAEFLASQAEKGGGHPDTSVIFIVGMPRSGTTLVEQILASHPDVHGSGELTALSDIAHSLRADKTGSKFPESVLELAGSDYALEGQRYIESVKCRVSDWIRVTDKMPYNFQLIGLIRLLLPKARVIHCVRNPLDNGLSIFKNYFHGAHLFAYDLSEIGAYYRLYQEMMHHWREVLPGGIYDVQYEELVANQERETRGLLDHLGLSWHEACLSFYETKRRVATASAMQVRRPIYRDSLKLSERYGELLKPLREALQGDGGL